MLPLVVISIYKGPFVVERGALSQSHWLAPWSLIVSLPPFCMLSEALPNTTQELEVDFRAKRLQLSQFWYFTIHASLESQLEPTTAALQHDIFISFSRNTSTLTKWWPNHHCQCTEHWHCLCKFWKGEHGSQKIEEHKAEVFLVNWEASGVSIGNV